MIKINNGKLSKEASLRLWRGQKMLLKVLCLFQMNSFRNQLWKLQYCFRVIKKTCSNQKLLKKAHVVSLSQMLRKFRNEIDEHLKALENLGEAINDSCVWFIFSLFIFIQSVRKIVGIWGTQNVRKLTNLQYFIDFFVEKRNSLQNIKSVREFSNSLHDI